MLADPSFILEPHLDGASGEVLRDGVSREFREIFLKTSWASRSLCGCKGRPDMLL